ncbi:hypothetical protein CMI42_05010 [Candidatus Pacearchaeota archaeon]|nr:hypothetical protein [Candidatus Pacearchaeota archaeon]|tara:strand:- start:1629 stop:1901 length:273 start_codon:yes stop_codon:yes gene_type:complete
MKQETGVQLIALIILVTVSLFYNPFSANFEGKLIFFGIVLATALFLVVFDLYKLIEQNRIKIGLFDEKLALLERIKSLENFKRDVENEKK